MLIIPLTGKIRKENPPVVTILIMLVNIFVFFVCQSKDGNRYSNAMNFYFNSGLARIEIVRYAEYLQAKNPESEKPESAKPRKWNQETFRGHYTEMQKDDVFMHQLLHDEMITPSDPIYPSWKKLRGAYEDLRSKIVSYRFGFKPAAKDYPTAISYMFLHGGFFHLLGNMFFLWLVGCILELGFGRIPYLCIYLATGFLSAELFSLVYAKSTVPLIGASGAISGLMGAYALVYGRRKIKVFYSTGFYFSYARLPGIVLLPVWIANEVFQLYFGGSAQIAYVAHIGGLVSGAGLGFVDIRLLGMRDKDVFKQDPREKIPVLLEDGLQRIAELDLAGARPRLEQVLEIDPGNPSALTHLFNIDKLNPKSERFHKTASRLLRVLSRDGDHPEELYHVFKEYCRLSDRPRLGLDSLFKVALIFSTSAHVDEAEKIMAFLLRKNPRFQKIPAGLLTLARAYRKLGAWEKGRRWLNVICQKYPESVETQIARRLLKEPF